MTGGVGGLSKDYKMDYRMDGEDDCQRAVEDDRDGRMADENEDNRMLERRRCKKAAW